MCDVTHAVRQRGGGVSFTNVVRTRNPEGVPGYKQVPLGQEVVGGRITRPVANPLTVSRLDSPLLKPFPASADNIPSGREKTPVEKRGQSEATASPKREGLSLGMTDQQVTDSYAETEDEPTAQPQGDSPCVDDCESAEKALQLAQFAFDHFADGIFWLKANGRCIYVNDAACQFLGYLRTDLLRQNFCKLVPGLDQKAWRRLRYRLSQTGSLIEPFQYIAQDESILPGETWLSRLKFGDKEYYLAFVRDAALRAGPLAYDDELQNQVEKKVTERTTVLQAELAGREKIEMAMLNETERVQSILDNAGQGFLTFGPDLKVHISYSEECRKLFGKEIWNHYFPELLFPDNPEQQQFLEAILGDYFTENDPNLLSIYHTLLPSEVPIGDAWVQVNYKHIPLVGDEEGARMLVVMTDISENRKLQQQIDEERNLLTMVVKAVVNFRDLMDALKDYRVFCSSGLENLLTMDEPPARTLADIVRVIHTFKGTFGQLGFVYAVAKFHELESDLLREQNRLTHEPHDKLREFISPYRIENWLDEDVAALERILGKEYFDQGDRILVNPAEIMELEHKAAALLKPAESNFLLPKIRRLRYRPFNQLLHGYPEYVAELSERLQKPVQPLVIEGGAVMVDPDHYRGMARSLGHIFRNSIDHGLEAEEDRVALGKDEAGKLTCRITEEGGDLVVTIADDGRGIDVPEVRRKIAEQGELSETEVTLLSNRQVIELLLERGLTTKTGVTELSGRGVGLAAVRREVERLGGSINVGNEPGQGTQFRIAVPLAETDDRNVMKLHMLMPSILRNASTFLGGDMGLKLQPDSGQSDSVRITLEDVTAMIGLRGNMIGTFFLSIEKRLACYLVRNFSEDDLSDEESVELMEDAVAEIANTILGNALSAFPNLGNLVAIGSPFTIRSKRGSTVGFSGPGTYGSRFETDQGSCSIGLLISNTLE